MVQNSTSTEVDASKYSKNICKPNKISDSLLWKLPKGTHWKDVFVPYGIEEVQRSLMYAGHEVTEKWWALTGQHWNSLHCKDSDNTG